MEMSLIGKGVGDELLCVLGLSSRIEVWGHAKPEVIPGTTKSHALHCEPLHEADSTSTSE